MNEGWTSVVLNNRDPVYLQVVRHFKERIATGRLKAGQVIPSRRELGALLKINPNTAQKAYKEMEEQRLIITEGNSPSRITEEADILRAIRSELIEDAVEAFVVSVGRIDVPVDELLDLVRAKYIEERTRTNQVEGVNSDD
ncbi:MULTISPECIES: GntR family transcriptional regulator [Paenibacillus]|uniref:GntR family transcriptional regulator n=1 Tax=Paenibacillus alvei TaxID=44250 RepID=A0ABT4E917_PAEAL|nr:MULTISPECIES: GntR family transcriptional regulator [Paenibacillus]MCY9530233.1 GntR family transcriptional regulator [Paenibacillus alvei]SDF66837.1 DNA-binding transcriptional regulator YhcF, GntR family [Paenibacillus sp. cl6col]